MTGMTAVYLCGRLSRDADERVREIGRRCLREYSEFTGMKYARLTTRDEEWVAAAAHAAREKRDLARARLLDEGADMIRGILRG
jgi:hypothetical protein